MRFENKFDVIIGLQNALSSLKGDTNELIKKCVNLLNFGGKTFFSTYSDQFWKYRLQWFEEQSEKGLLGEIDKSKTGNGAVICKDGFRSDTFTEEQLRMIDENSLQPCVEHAIRYIKRFKILSSRYRNKRKRRSLRVSLLSTICNFMRG